jgi:tyrosyl-tRNA synthetase
MDIVAELKARGLIEHSSAEPEKIFEKGRTIYLGVDPSADSLQIGNLAIVLLLRRLSDAGHRIILLVGGGTGMIGDPRDKGERTLLDTATIERNKRGIRNDMQKVIGKSVRIVDNADWLLKVKLVPFLRDIGQYFTVNDLIKRDIIKKRLDTPDESISYTEFTYSLLQGYDYLMLNQKYKCDLQIGGSDQWTNLLSGVDLIRKKDGKEAYALTMPLITDSNGKKFGKSEGNAVWLNPKKTSPFQFYQFWLAVADADVERYLKVYTLLPVNEISAMVELHTRNPERRQAQRMLAKAVTEIVHGKTEANRAEKFTEVLYGSGSFESLTKIEQQALAESMPSVEVSVGDSVITALTATFFLESKAEAKRLISGKGIKLNGSTVEEDRPLATDDFKNGIAMIQKGKADKLLVRLK